MKKLKTLTRRIKNMSFRRLFLNINKIHKDSKKPRFIIFIDMVWCAFRYGVGYLDYNVFGFAYIRGSKNRKTFMTQNDNIRLISLANDNEYKDIFLNKINFNKTFSPYLGRKWLDLRQSSLNDFINFASGRPDFFAKEIDGCGGVGIKKIRLSPKTDFKKLKADLIGKKMFLAEETLNQHEAMAKLNPSSINTLRITSGRNKGGVFIMYSLIRIGDGTKDIDNISTGGMYTGLDEEGRLKKHAFCDKTGEKYESHPKTQIVFEGYQVPFYKESLDLIKKAAELVPQVRYVGWDVAISPEGPVLIEGNLVPSYDMCQNYIHTKSQKGILPKFKKVFGPNFRD